MTRTVNKRAERTVEHRPAGVNGGGWFERFLFAIMGPASIGEDKAPDGYVPDEAANLCHRCGQPWDAHERVHTDNMTYRPCPGSPD